MRRRRRRLHRCASRSACRPPARASARRPAARRCRAVWTSSGSSSPGSTSSSTSAIVIRPHIAAQRVEVARGVAEDEVAVPVALPGPHQAEVGDDRLLQHVLRVAVGGRRPRVSLAGEATATLPSASYLHGRPPSATWVPTPVAVKNAGMPAPPARIRSASVPCGRQLDLELAGRGTAARTPCSRRRTRRSSGASAWLEEQPAQAPVVDAAVVGDRLEVGGARPGAARRSAPTGCRTARTRRRRASRRPGCRPRPRRPWRPPCPCRAL